MEEAFEQCDDTRDHWTVSRQKPDGVSTQLKHTGFRLLLHRPDSQTQLLTVRWCHTGFRGIRNSPIRPQ